MNYLELKIPIKKNAEWFVALRNAMASEGIPVKWESGSFHITAVFIYDDQPVEELKSAFSRRLTARKAPSLTLDKLDAFTTKNDIIVNVTASQLSESLAALIEEVRSEAASRNVDMRRSFILHITLGRIDMTAANLPMVKKIIDSIAIPAFTLYIKKANYRYKGGKIIQTWQMD
jgi:2'-5' RNA ligase